MMRLDAHCSARFRRPLSTAKDAYFPFPLCFTFFGLGQGCPVLLDAKIANETLECLEEERRMPTW
jgi:hypothetical protein